MNIRPATKDDVQFLKKMLYEAARWNPDWPREPIEEVLADPVLVRYHQGWGREGDGGVVAEVDAVPVGAAWYRLFTAEDPGYGFVDDKIPELSIAVVPLAPAEGDRRGAAPIMHGAGPRGGVPGVVALGRRAQPVADDVSEGRVREGR